MTTAVAGVLCFPLISIDTSFVIAMITIKLLIAYIIIMKPL